MNEKRRLISLVAISLSVLTLAGCGIANQGLKTTGRKNITSNQTTNTTIINPNYPYVTFQRILSEGPNGGNAFQIVATHGFVWKEDVKSPKLVTPTEFSVQIENSVHGALPVDKHIPIHNNAWVRYITLQQLNPHTVEVYAFLSQPARKWFGMTSGGFMFGFGFKDNKKE